MQLRVAPEVEEIEPIVGIALAVFLQQRGIADDRRSDRSRTFGGADGREIRQAFKYQMVVIAATVQSKHEDYGAAQQRRGAHGAHRKSGATAEKVHVLQRFSAERAIAQDSDESAFVQTLADFEH